MLYQPDPPSFGSLINTNEMELMRESRDRKFAVTPPKTGAMPEAGERLFKVASQTSPEVIAFLRKYIEDANK